MVWLLKAFFTHNLFYNSYVMVARIKNILILMVYEKILALPKNVVEKHEIGRITNMISNDFNTI